MATEDLYSTDSYLRTFEAVVQRAGPDGVVLDRTAFYPRGGGQPGDTGELRAGNEVWPVTRVQRRAGDIAHAVEGDPPEPGTQVQGSLDWERRFRFMRLHTALHALSGIVWTGWNADVTGSNISDNGERARMDFSLEGIRINEIKQEIEDRLNESLAAGREVKVYEAAPRRGLPAAGPDPHPRQPGPRAHSPDPHRGDRGPRPPGGRRHPRGQHRRGWAGAHRQRRQQGTHQPASRNRPGGLTCIEINRPALPRL